MKILVFDKILQYSWLKTEHLTVHSNVFSTAEPVATTIAVNNSRVRTLLPQLLVVLRHSMNAIHLCLWLLNSSKDIDQVVLSMLNVNREGQAYPKRDTSLQLSEE